MKTKRKKREKYDFGTGLLNSVGQMGGQYLIGSALQGIGGILDPLTQVNPVGQLLKDQSGNSFAEGGVVPGPDDPKYPDYLPNVSNKKFRKVKGDGSMIGDFGAKVINYLQSPEVEGGIKKFRKVGKPITQLIDPTGVTNWKEAADTWADPNSTTVDKVLNTISAIPFAGEFFGGAGKIAKKAGKSEAGWKLFGEGLSKSGDAKQIGEAMFANGGVVGAGGNTPVEVEDDEIAETPQGQVMQFDGATHEQGGIDVDLPAGTKIFSDRIAIDGKTMQQRKASRVRRLSKLTKASGEAVDDNTLKRMSQFMDLEEEGDLLVQQAAKHVSTMGKQKYALGTDGDGIPNISAANPDPFTGWLNNLMPGQGDNDILPQMADSTPSVAGAVPSFSSPNRLASTVLPTGPISPITSGSPLTTGDITGMAGNAFSAISPLLSTISNRAGDRPNVNKFKNFGNDALQANANAKGSVAAIRDNAIRSVQLKENGARARNRNSASSVNTLRALDTATDSVTNDANSNIEANYAQQLMGLFSQQSQLENQQDQVVMGGDQQADLADRQDRDAYYTNLSKNLTGVGTAIQKQGKDLNQNAYNNDLLSILPDMSKYGLGYSYDKKGKPVLTKLK